MPKRFFLAISFYLKLTEGFNFDILLITRLAKKVNYQKVFADIDSDTSGSSAIHEIN